MNFELANSLLFMDKMQRIRVMESIEGFSDFVNESGQILLHHDYENHSIDYVKENMINRIQNIGETPQEKAYLKGLASKVLSPTRYTVEAVNENYQRVMSLSPAKLNGLVNILFDIEKQKYEAKMRPDMSRGEEFYANGERVKNTASMLDVLDDAIAEILSESQEYEYLELVMPTITDMLNNPQTKCFDYIVNFKIAEMIEVAQNADDGNAYLDIIKRSRIMNESSAVSLITLTNFITSKSAASSRLTKILNKEKNKIESQIDIILADYEMNSSKTIIPETLLDSGKHEIIPTIIAHLKEGLESNRVQTHIVGKKPFTTNIEYKDIFKLKNAYSKMQFEKCLVKSGSPVWLMTDYVNLYLLLVDTTTSDVITVQLAKNCIMTQELEVLLGCDCIPPDRVKVTRIKFKGSDTINLDHVTEGIKFTEDGGFKLTYTRGTSFMDDYSKINKVIVLNARNKSYEAMKTDLMILFAFINELESILQGRENLKDSVREDAMKARAFAKGDFKQYLAIVQTADPQFNFSKYFEENYVNKGKVLVEFSNAEVKGFKKLLRTIIG